MPCRLLAHQRFERVPVPLPLLLLHICRILPPLRLPTLLLHRLRCCRWRQALKSRPDRSRATPAAHTGCRALGRSCGGASCRRAGVGAGRGVASVLPPQRIRPPGSTQSMPVLRTLHMCWPTRLGHLWTPRRSQSSSKLRVQACFPVKKLPARFLQKRRRSKGTSPREDSSEALSTSPLSNSLLLSKPSRQDTVVRQTP